MEEYWYAVCVGSNERTKDALERAVLFVDGWVYGAYIDIVDKKKLEEYFKNE